MLLQGFHNILCFSCSTFSIIRVQLQRTGSYNNFEFASYYVLTFNLFLFLDKNSKDNIDESDLPKETKREFLFYEAVTIINAYCVLCTMQCVL